MTRHEPMTVGMRWAERGFPSFPIAIGWDDTKQGTTKRPLTPHGHQDATTDPEVVRDLFVQYGDRLRHGEELAAGMRPDGFVVVDADRHGHGDGPAYATSIGLNGTWTVDTASGGEHRLYRKPDGATFTNSVPEAWRGLIDVRADGGWIVCPGTGTSWGTWAPRTPWNPDEVTDLPDHVATMLTPTSNTTGGWRTYTPDRDNPLLHPFTVELHDLLVDQYGVNPDLTVVRQVADGDEVRHVLDVCRPGKRGGVSGTVGFVGPDVLYVFTDNWPGLPGNRSYSLQRLAGADPVIIDTDQGGDDDSDRPAALAYLINWSDAYQGGDKEIPWLVDGVIERGRLVAIYSAPKAGKSLLMLDMAAALASGRGVLGQPPTGEVVPVLYCDYENTVGDVVDRLRDLGYGDPDDLTELHYLSLPSIPPLDTPDGGRALTAAAEAVGAQLVIVDTASRSISGTEDASDTWLAWYTSTGLRLKRAGIALVRLDHSGKDARKGQRGSSAKASDVDLVLLLVEDHGRLDLIAEQRRQAHYADRTTIRRHEVNGVLRHEVANPAQLADQATRDLIAYLDQEGVPGNAGRQTVKQHLEQRGHKATKRSIESAIRIRKFNLGRVRHES